ncbi:MAG: tRNA pseudouridine(38-40) synthase TruA [Burkholderiales bacterium]|nr:tRNA pseudouridine(38-40) synthase TruA [Burkholderiales bacterium]
MGLSYRGQAYRGWQSQPGGRTVQDALEQALAAFAGDETGPLPTVCAGRTDAGVHALNQVVHLDTSLVREPVSWVRGTNRHLPADIALQWCRPVGDAFHARSSAHGRRYRFVLLESPVRPSLEQGLVGWVFRPLDGPAMRQAAALLIGEHDFSAFRAADCQAATPVKTLRTIAIERRGAYWRFDFDASAFLYHMVRNIMGCLVAVGSGRRAPGWLAEVLASRSREAAAPTFPAAGLYFLGPYYDAAWALPAHAPALDWLP